MKRPDAKRLLSGLVTEHAGLSTHLLDSNYWHQINNPILNAIAGLAVDKNISLAQPTSTKIESIDLPGTVYLPLHYRGKTLTPAVEKNQSVSRGQSLVYPAIDAADNTPKPGLKSPVHGVVSECQLEIKVTADGLPLRFIAVDTDDNQSVDTSNYKSDFSPAWATANTDQRLQLLVDHGIVGHGGGGFLLANKLRANIHTLVINAVECEPLISCDRVLLHHKPNEILLGILALISLTNCKQCLIATETSQNDTSMPDNSLAEAVDLLRKNQPNDEIDLLFERISFHSVRRQYPAGAERVLIKSLTGKVIESNKTPADYGICCVNVATCHALYPVAYHDMPPEYRVVTVSGDAVAKGSGAISRNFLTPIGTPIRKLLEATGALNQDDTSRKVLRVLQGGPLCGTELESLDTPVTQQTHCVIATFSPAVSAANACIRCTTCQDVCPVNLMPQELHRLIRVDDITAAAEMNLQDCLLCGYCDLVCPSQIPLTRQFRRARQSLHEQAQTRQLALLAEARFEQRQQRLDKKAKEKEQLRAERRSKATSDSARKQAIDAALSRVRDRKQNSE